MYISLAFIITQVKCRGERAFLYDALVVLKWKHKPEQMNNSEEFVDNATATNAVEASRTQQKKRSNRLELEKGRDKKRSAENKESLFGSDDEDDDGSASHNTSDLVDDQSPTECDSVSDDED